MKFDIITIFPKIFDSYFNESILARAHKQGLIQIKIHNLRDYTADKHKSVDDSPYGGGAGMVLRADVIVSAMSKIKSQKSKSRTKIVVFSAKGKQFDQKMAYDWSKKLDQIIFICGRYEGIDERVVKILRAEEISIGPYVLTDGEVPAMAVVSAVSRLIPGVIKLESLAEESHWSRLVKREVKGKKGDKGGGLEYPHYTRPEVLEYQGKKYRVPKILLSGDHKKIEEWRKSKTKTPA
ncbi:MAG: tRNA (guanosine(37)-N1)-methyltransferase TrmD [Minisyncoccia bacterium]